MKQIRFMGKLYDVPDNLEGQELLDFLAKLEDAANRTVAGTKQNEITRGAKKLAEYFDIEYDETMSIKDVRDVIKDKMEQAKKKQTEKKQDPEKKPDDDTQQKLEQAYLDKLKKQKEDHLAEVEKLRAQSVFDNLGIQLGAMGIAPNEIEPTKIFAMSQYKINESGKFLDPVSGLLLTDKDQKPLDTKGLAELLKSNYPGRFQNPISGQGLKPEFTPLTQKLKTVDKNAPATTDLEEDMRGAIEAKFQVKKRVEEMAKL